MCGHTSIQNALSSFSDSINRRDWLRFTSLFIADALLELTNDPYPIRYQGADGITVGVRGLVDPAQFLIQMNTPAVITVEGDRATAHSTLFETGILPKKGFAFDAYMLADDVLSRVEGRWLIVSRRIEFQNFRSTPIAS